MLEMLGAIATILRFFPTLRKREPSPAVNHNNEDHRIGDNVSRPGQKKTSRPRL
jgi:hypothetical protein